MLVWEPTEGKAQFIRFMCRTYEGALQAADMLSNEQKHTTVLYTLLTKREYSYLSRWFPVHVSFSNVYILADKYEPAWGRISSNSTYVPRREAMGVLYGKPLISMYVPVQLSMAVDLEAHLNALSYKMNLNALSYKMNSHGILAGLEEFFAHHVLHDEQCEMQHQILLKAVNGFHNNFQNSVLTRLIRALTICLP